MEIKPVNEKRYFLISNLLKGIFYLILVLVVFLLLRKFSSEEQRYAWFGSIYNNLPLVMAL
ncbi:MAG: hypothetical protein WDZ72_08860, partial [Cyclobacteriaceae bacterium]